MRKGSQMEILSDTPKEVPGLERRRDRHLSPACSSQPTTVRGRARLVLSGTPGTLPSLQVLQPSPSPQAGGAAPTPGSLENTDVIVTTLLISSCLERLLGRR